MTRRILACQVGWHSTEAKRPSVDIHLGEIRVSGSARIARQTMYGNMQVDEEDDDDENDDSDITADDDGTRKVGDGAA